MILINLLYTPKIHFSHHILPLPHVGNKSLLRRSSTLWYCCCQAGGHSLILLTMASKSWPWWPLSCPSFMPSCSPPTHSSHTGLLLFHENSNLTHSPPWAFSCVVSTSRKVLPRRFCLGFPLTPPSSLHKCHLLKVPFPDHPL